MLETLKKLCKLSGPSGFEDEVREYILEKATAYADSVMTDSMGNLIVTKAGAKKDAPRILICAHMDEVGLIITGADDDGCLRFDFLGGIDRRVIIGKRVFIGNAKVPGIVGLKAYHLVDREEEKTVPKRTEMYIDIGCASKDEALKLVSLGDYAVFDSGVVEFGEGFIKARAIDDRAGCAAMLKLLEQELPCDCTFAFTVQEEVGTRGAKIAAARVCPDYALILETTTAADLPEVSEGKRICRLGGGPVIPFMDKGTLYTPMLYRLLTELADKNGIRWQTKNVIAGGTDASAIQRSGLGAAVAGIAVPVRNIHSPASVAKISDFEDIPRLAKLFLEAVCEF